MELIVLDGENASLKNGHTRVETRVLKALACRNGFWTPFITDAEVTIKICFGMSSPKGGRQGFEKGINRGPTLGNFIVGRKHRKNSILESCFFIVVAFSQEMQ